MIWYNLLNCIKRQTHTRKDVLMRPTYSWPSTEHKLFSKFDHSIYVCGMNSCEYVNAPCHPNQPPSSDSTGAQGLWLHLQLCRRSHSPGSTGASPFHCGGPHTEPEAEQSWRDASFHVSVQLSGSGWAVHQHSPWPYTSCRPGWESLDSWASPFGSCREEVPGPPQLLSPKSLQINKSSYWSVSSCHRWNPFQVWSEYFQLCFLSSPLLCEGHMGSWGLLRLIDSGWRICV